MKKLKWISRMLAFTVVGGWAAWAAASPFADLPQTHWAREAVEQLSAKGILKGYGDGTFKGGKAVNRYEVAMVIHKLVESGALAGKLDSADEATLRRLIAEFSDELKVISSRVGKLEKDLKETSAEVKQLKENGVAGKINFSADMRLRFQTIKRPVDTLDTNDWPNHFRFGLNMKMDIDQDISAYVRFLRDEILVGEIGAGGTPMVFDEAYVDMKNFLDFGDLRLGRQWMSVGHSIVMDDKMDGVQFKKMIDKVGMTMFAFSTRASNSGVNDQHFGDASGMKTYYMYSDARSIVKGGGAVNYGTGAGLNGGTALAAFTPGDQITLYATPYEYPRPYDSFNGTKTGINGGAADWTYNNHSGIALQGGYGIGGGDLAPISLPASAATGVRNNFATTATGSVYNYIAAIGTLDTAGTDGQTPAGVTRDWQIQSQSGLDSWGINLACDFGGHNLTGYYIQRHYDKYDPYTRLGDPWAAMVDYNNDMVVDVDVNGVDLSPSADPTYLGFTLDGGILKNLNYFFEFVSFDPDINNIGVDPNTGVATTALGQWKGNNLDSGQAWVLGLDWDITKDYSLLVQYGVGDEEFIPISIYEGKMLNGMYGRTNNDDGSVGGSFNYVEGQYSLTGVKDLILKLSARFTDKSSGFIKYEKASDNDNSAVRLIAGDPSVTGHPSQDYTMISLLFQHKYTPRTTIVLQYDTLEYDNSAVNESTRIGVEGTNADDANYGGWDYWLRANISVKI